MKSKLTLSIDPLVTHKAKQIARQRGKSLSAVVEESLRALSVDSEQAGDAGRFSERWLGKMEVKVEETERGKKLRQKYQISDGS